MRRILISKDYLETIEAVQIPAGQVFIWWLGGASLGIKSPEVLIYVDPYFGPSTSKEWQRRNPSFINPDRIKMADAVLITHEHRDHCNEPTLRGIYQNTSAAVYAPKLAITRLTEEYALSGPHHLVKEGDSFEVGDLEINVLESGDNESRDAVSYLIKNRAGTILHPGDTLYSDIFKKISKEFHLDIVFLPLGKNPPGKKFYLEPDDFYRVAKDLKADTVVPIHWDLWQRTYLDATTLIGKFPDINLKVMKPGERMELGHADN